VENLATGETFVDKADVVISARGTLNDIAWPDIPGLKDMQIPVMHSAAWKQEYVLHNYMVSLLC
jgi:cation diffusion facilitator CzcD-associated flavoprotein CzcO